MQDRYLFRAKRIDNGEWVKGYYAKLDFVCYRGAEIEVVGNVFDNPDLLEVKR